MFSKKDKAGGPNAAAALRRGRAAPSIISEDLTVHGDLVAGGDIQVDGTVHGDVRSQSLTIGEHATVTGAVVAEDVVVRGRVLGSIRGRRVQLAASCHVEGDILHESLAIETGAFFEGSCRHSDDPLAGDADLPVDPATAFNAAEVWPATTAASSGAAIEAAAGQGDDGTDAADQESGMAVGDSAVVVRRPAAQ